MSTPGDIFEALGREARARIAGGARQGISGARVYRGRTVAELLPRIQRELGPDAIVTRQREGLTGGILGFFQHAFVEIEAMPGAPRLDVYDEASSAVPPALDEGAPAPTAGALGAPGGAQVAPPPAGSPPVPAPAPAIAPSIPASAYTQPPAQPYAYPPPQQPPAAPFPPPALAQQPEPQGGAYVTGQLAALARAGARTALPSRPVAPIPPSVDFHELIPQRPARRPPPPLRRQGDPVRAALGPPAERTSLPGSHARARASIERSLRRYGISEELAGELIEGASAHTLPLAPHAGLAAAVRSTLAQRIPVAPPLASGGAAIAVVGAGGAGKTTCVAALLAAYRTHSGLPASCATLTVAGDGGELQMILTPQLMRPTGALSARAVRALRKVRAGGLAVIDAPRTSPADRAAIRTLAGLLTELAPDRIVVALPATLGTASASQLLSALAPLGANALVVTHADETDQIGVAVEVACRFALAPEYMLQRSRSGGWRMNRLDPATLASMLLP